MYRLLIVDDEPLARMGVKSLLSNSQLDIEVIGMAQNGKEAAEMISAQQPDIVITDIKMPVMSGLELLEYINQQPEPHPLFIMLTSYEEFDFVRRALKCEACDYLIKVELTREILDAALSRLIEKLKSMKNTNSYVKVENVLISRFYFNLLNYGYTSEKEIVMASNRLGESIHASEYIVLIGRFDNLQDNHLNQEDYNIYYLSLLDTVKTAINMYTRCIVNAFNYRSITIVLFKNDAIDFKTFCDHALRKANELSNQYFGVTSTFIVGQPVSRLIDLAPAFSQLKTHMSVTYPSGSINYCNDIAKTTSKPPEENINVAKISRKLIESFENNNLDLFNETIGSVQKRLDQLTIDAAINCISSIVHVIIHCLDHGEKILSRLFSYNDKSYQILYTYTSKQDIIEYLSRIQTCINQLIQEQSGSSQIKLVVSAKKYIKENINKKLTLNEVAEAIGISQNYLSAIFKQHNNYGFTDYVARQKIKKAQKLLAEENLKVYEVSDMLGFDNPQYFSKVYKKITGHAPTRTHIYYDADHA